MVELLKTYKEHNKRYPSTIFIFRDGVSEGQLDKLKSIELAKIEAAVKKVIGATKTPTKLSLIVVQKRHHTRFACVEERKLGNKSTYNVPKGTVVDTMIVDPEREEFYLASHDSPMVHVKSLFEKKLIYLFLSFRAPPSRQSTSRFEMIFTSRWPIYRNFATTLVTNAAVLV